jgi:hypothetical protein
LREHTHVAAPNAVCKFPKHLSPDSNNSRVYSPFLINLELLRYSGRALKLAKHLKILWLSNAKSENLQWTLQHTPIKSCQSSSTGQAARLGQDRSRDLLSSLRVIFLIGLWYAVFSYMLDLSNWQNGI